MPPSPVGQPLAAPAPAPPAPAPPAPAPLAAAPALDPDNDGNGAVREIASSGERRRDELAHFLRTRRTALKPEDVGLAGGGRRRTPGLRREEVAQLAGVGVTWYTWLEQGRDVRASLDVLEALARALRLSRAERTHLILLGRGEEPPPCKAPAERVSPSLRRLIEHLGPNPAYILGRRWDYLAWNDAAAALLGDFARIPRASRNHAWLTFTDPARREMFTDWECSARTLVGKFRADSARHIGDPEFESLIAALRATSPEFACWWELHEVSQGGGARKDLRHPAAGLMSFTHAVFHPAEALEQRLILYSPLPDHHTPAKLAGLLAERAVARGAGGAPAGSIAPAQAAARRGRAAPVRA
ncbi:MAG TPA: helix-turn-helix transcriptional regulator [Solirubrobacteraceae bacterium]|nr:helix-turn-helix transcriptional regulator [Solirubrobacteraceae bacterium]